MPSFDGERCVQAEWSAMRLKRRELLAAAGTVLLFQGAAFATEEALLVIRSPAGERMLSRADLEALPQHSFTTSTIWTIGRANFSGPPLINVLATAGIKTGYVELIAINDYRVSIEVAGLAPLVPILATRVDGKAFPRRKKGPLWLVYPYDDDPDFRSEAIYARSIWQVIRIDAAAA